MYTLVTTYFGYLASLMLIIALLVKTEVKFRWYNILGCIIFISYAIIIGAFPVLLTNSILLFINVYYLIKFYKKNESFDVLEFRSEDELIHKFLDFYKQDIALYFPAMDAQQMHGNLNFVITRDLVIANIFSAKLMENGDAVVLINYTTAKYRDFKVGPFIFDKEKDFLTSKGVKRIVYDKMPYKKHLEYLKVIGFVQEGNCMIKAL